MDLKRACTSCWVAGPELQVRSLVPGWQLSWVSVHALHCTPHSSLPTTASQPLSCPCPSPPCPPQSCASSTLTPSPPPPRSASCARASCFLPPSLATTRSTSSRCAFLGSGCWPLDGCIAVCQCADPAAASTETAAADSAHLAVHAQSACCVMCTAMLRGQVALPSGLWLGWLLTQPACLPACRSRWAMTTPRQWRVAARR